MYVVVTRKDSAREIFRNASEVHYNYAQLDSNDPSNRIAIESSIHKTGNTISIDEILEVEITEDTAIADNF